MSTVVKVRKIWRNKNSSKNQVTVQFAQEGVTNTGNASNSLIALAQGVTASKGAVYALMSFNANEAEKYFGTTDVDYSQKPFEQWGSVDKLEAAIGDKLNISVVENTTKNPNAPNQEPKINPSTGDIQTYYGSPIFRHTELVVGKPRKEFLESDQQRTKSSIPDVVVEEKVFSLDSFGVTR
jgi:hypothetical protein